MRKVKAGFIGYGTRALDALMEHDGFEVQCFIAPQSRLCSDVFDARKRYPSLDFHIVKNNAELLEVLKQYSSLECFVMNACPIILNAEVIGAARVFNIHPGSLKYNRGHQPHLWTVLLAEKESEIVIHSVTEGIDEGEIIGREVRSIRGDMNALEVLDYLEDQVPLLLDSLYAYLVDGAPAKGTVMGGEYRHVMTYSDYEISLDNIDPDNFSEDALRKIRTRSMHHGAFFVYEGERIYVDRLLYEERIGGGGQNGAAKVSFYGSVVFVEYSGYRWIFNLNQRKGIST